jgi:hypothetical protein
MVTILSQGPTSDGYDVRFLNGTQAETLHFKKQPADADAAISAVLQAREDVRLIFTFKGEADA